jgi:hypothetical protein
MHSRASLFYWRTTLSLSEGGKRGVPHLVHVGGGGVGGRDTGAERNRPCER